MPWERTGAVASSISCLAALPRASRAARRSRSSCSGANDAPEIRCAARRALMPRGSLPDDMVFADEMNRARLGTSLAHFLVEAHLGAHLQRDEVRIHNAVAVKVDQPAVG